MSNIGKNVPRVDGWPKVLGEPIYTGDMKLPGMLHCAIHRSTRPHARIRGIDVSRHYSRIVSAARPELRLWWMGIGLSTMPS